MHKVLLSSQSYEWYTPDWLICRISAVLDGIDLDPASNAIAQSVVRANHWCGFDHPDPAMRDGLAIDWSAYRSVFLNPPFGKTINRFARKVADHGRTTPMAVIVPARTNTQWWRLMTSVPHTLLLITHRIKFWSRTHPRPTTEPFSSILLWYNSSPNRIRQHFSEYALYTQHLCDIGRNTNQTVE